MISACLKFRRLISFFFLLFLLLFLLLFIVFFVRIGIFVLVLSFSLVFEQTLLSDLALSVGSLALDELDEENVADNTSHSN